MASEKPSAAVVIAPLSDGRFAAVRSRKRNGRVGLPGGKVEPWEAPEAAAARELYEETGLTANRLMYLGTRQDENHLVAVYLAPAWKGEMRSSREGDALWASEEDLSGPGSAYPDFNTWAFGVLRGL